MGDLGLFPGWGRLPGVREGYPLQCSGLRMKELNMTESLILSLSALFMVRLLYPYMAAGKTIALTCEPLLAK